jgi:hypothetical protein
MHGWHRRTPVWKEARDFCGGGDARALGQPSALPDSRAASSLRPQGAEIATANERGEPTGPPLATLCVPPKGIPGDTHDSRAAQSLKPQGTGTATANER